MCVCVPLRIRSVVVSALGFHTVIAGSIPPMCVCLLLVLFFSLHTLLLCHLNTFHLSLSLSPLCSALLPEHFSNRPSVTAARFPFGPFSSVLHCEHVIAVHCFGSVQFTPKNRRIYSVWFTPSAGGVKGGGRKEVFPISHTFISSFSPPRGSALVDLRGVNPFFSSQGHLPAPP